MSNIMTVSRNGQVSIPAETRARWKAKQVVVVDMGDYVVMGPLSGDPITDLRGRYAGRGPSSDEMRKTARKTEAERDTRQSPRR